MNSTEREQEIAEVEERFWAAMQHKDASAAAELTDDGCIVVGARGVSTVDSERMAQLVVDGGWRLRQFSIDDAKHQIRFLTDDIAIVGYPVHERIETGGETLDFQAHDAAVWVRRDGKWRCALHSETLAGDPYGRDRRRDERQK
jgi:uncharacterized protein (TIGR02246 family)